MAIARDRNAARKHVARQGDPGHRRRVRDHGDHASAVAALSQYHLCYGVGTHHFRSAGAAMIQALEQELGCGFSAELGQAWAAVCEWVGQIILETSHPMAA